MRGYPRHHAVFGAVGGMKLKVLDLFSGIGGFSLGLERTGGFETVAFCEIEDFPRKVLRKHWPNVPIVKDVRTLHAADLPVPVDVICGGYPCQPFSLAGKRAGAADDRHLWPEMFRLVQEIRPHWVIAENVAGHVNMGLDQVLSDLEGEGYETTAFIIPACAVNAPHRRDRVWIMAHSESARTGGRCGQANNKRRIPCEEREGGLADGNFPLPDPDHRERQQELRIEKPDEQIIACAQLHCCAVADAFKQRRNRRMQWAGWWEREPLEAVQDARERGGEENGVPIPEPLLGRVAYGVPHRVDRLKTLGNAVVPQVVEMIGWAILEAERQ